MLPLSLVPRAKITVKGVQPVLLTTSLAASPLVYSVEPPELEPPELEATELEAVAVVWTVVEACTVLVAFAVVAAIWK